MRQEDKKLLLKDICARLPYGIIAFDGSFGGVDAFNLVGYDGEEFVDDDGYWYSVEDCKPYLFPLSSMTEEQKKYIADRWGVNEDFDFEIDPNGGEYFVDLGDVVNYVNWLIENHFDIYGLIPKGLAIDATGLTFINWRNREYDGN